MKSRPVSYVLAALASCALVLLSACQRQKEDPATNAPATAAAPAKADSATPARPPVEQMKPSLDIKTPPADAVKLPSGVSYKKLSTTTESAPARNDTVLIHFSGWKANTGETFNTTRNHDKPMPLDLSNAAPGFADVFTQVNRGERVMFWMPAEVVSGLGAGPAEPLTFEAELMEIQRAPAVPADLVKPPAGAKTTRGGARYVVLKPGAGDRPRSFDTVKFHITTWDEAGKMLHSTELRARPMGGPVERQKAPLGDLLTAMAVGQRVRVWVSDEQATAGENLLPTGTRCAELELLEITKGTPPPAVPKDVKGPPPGTKKTEAGVFYRVLKAGKPGPHPKPTDTVEVHYTGWTTDGKMFDSSVTRGAPAKFSLGGVIKGWTDGIPTMVVGEQTRFWIPEELAYKGQASGPKGMLVFDVELLSISETPMGGPPEGMGDPHGGHGGHGGHGH